MADYMGVCGLRYQRARLAGEIEKLKKQVRRNQEKVAALSKNIFLDEARIQELTADIDALGEAAHAAYGVELSAPVPRQTYVMRHFTAWGELTRGILAELAHANGRPMTTADLALALDAKYGLNLSTEQRRQLATSIRLRLRSLRKRHLVERIHAEYEIGPFSTWVLKASLE